MPAGYPLRALARLTAVAALVSLCAGGTLARTAPSMPSMPTAQLPPADRPIALPPGPLELASLEPGALPAPKPTPPSANGPFGLNTDKDTRYAARWQALQPLMRLERLILASCRAKAAPCPAAAAKFNAIIDAAPRPQRPRPNRRHQPGGQPGDSADERSQAIRRAGHLVVAACDLRLRRRRLRGLRHREIRGARRSRRAGGRPAAGAWCTTAR